MYLDEGIYILNCRGVYGDRRSKLLFVWLHAFLLTVLITLLFRYHHLPDLLTRLLFPVFYLIDTTSSAFPLLSGSCFSGGSCGKVS